MFIEHELSKYLRKSSSVNLTLQNLFYSTMSRRRRREEEDKTVEKRLAEKDEQKQLESIKDHYLS